MPFSSNAFKYVFGIILTLVQVFMPISYSKHNQLYSDELLHHSNVIYYSLGYYHGLGFTLFSIQKG
jgi:hypothetical protein